MQLCGSLNILWDCLSLGLEWKLTFSSGHCWVFKICWHIEGSIFTASSFRICDSTGIPSPPLALFIVMLPKTCLTSQSRMSGSRSVITPSWSSWVVKIFFVQFFCVLLPPLLNIFCFCSVHTISVLYWAQLCMKCSLGISNFLEEISSLSHSTAFLFLCTDHWGRLSYSSLLFFGTLHSNVYICPFLLCFFFSLLDMLIKTTMRCHLTPVRMAIIKIFTNK